MRTIVLQEPERLALTETDQPQSITPGEALVRVHRVGICGTDLHAYRGRQPFFTYPRTLGHELGVEVWKWVPTVKILLPATAAPSSRI
jgi:alcohol dehydrogenase